MRVAALALLLGSLACAGASPRTTTAKSTLAPKSMRIVREQGRPALAIVTRQGDPSGAVAAFVSTAGVGGRGAVVPTALAGVFEGRGAKATPQEDGVRVVLPMNDVRDGERLANVLLESVTTATDLGPVKRKLAALGALPHVPAELLAVAACEGSLVPPADLSMPTASELEAWRKAAVVRERVGFGVVGSLPFEHAPALASGPADAPTSPDTPLAIYDSGDANAPSAIHITWRGDLRLLGAARTLGAEHSAFDAMLVASDPGAHVRSVTAALSARGVCLSVRADLDGDAANAGAARAGALVALAFEHVRTTLAEDDAATVSPNDALDAAEQAAAIALASTREEPLRVSSQASVVVGVPSPATGARDTLARAIEAATRAWDSRVIEARVHVENGQPAAWLLIASPCGTAGESDGDAGASAAFALAAAHVARDVGVRAEPWIAHDGVGILASDRDVRKLVDALARSFVVDPIEGVRAAHGQLLDTVHPALASLAQALAPGSPAAVLPTGTAYGLLRLSDGAIAARGEALRRGPLRVAVIANVDAAQAEGIVTRADRWISREGARACPARATASVPKPGTYAVVTEDGSSEAYIAALVPEASDAEGATIAGALDGAGGLLEKSLGDGLSRSFGARLLGPPEARAIVIHLEAPSTALDAAVAQTRSLLDRLRQGAFTADDLARVKRQDDAARAARLADPRERLIALFRGEVPKPEATLDMVRATAAAVLHDEQLVIVAARPRTSQKLPRAP